jgi:hypothetical protein
MVIYRLHDSKKHVFLTNTCPMAVRAPHILEIPTLAAHHHHRHGWNYTARYHEIIKVGASHKNKNTPHAHAP